MRNVEEKLVSVIVTAYQLEQYIEKCIRSVFNQTYQNLEVIVVDDGSTDHTLQIIESLAKEDPRMIVISQENAGVSAARNRALQVVRGEYCTFLDGDDCLKKEAIANLYRAMVTEQADWARGQYERIQEDGERCRPFRFETGVFPMNQEKEKLAFVFEKQLCYKVGFEVWNTMYRSELIREYQIRFPENVRLGEDLAFQLCYAFVQKKYVGTDDLNYEYRVRQNSAVQTLQDIDVQFDEYQKLLSYVQAFLHDLSGYELFESYFCFVHLIGMGALYEKYSMIEMAETVKRSRFSVYFRRELKEALKKTKEFQNQFPIEIGNAREMWYRELLYLVGKKTLGKRIYYTCYNIIRRLLGKEESRQRPLWS